MNKEDILQIGPYALKSRLFLGTAAYPSHQDMLQALAAAQPSLVTVSLRRVSPTVAGPNLYQTLREHNYQLLPNTAGCLSAQEAIKTAMLAREALDTPLIKLEVIADEETLLPEPEGLLEAAEKLVREGFVVLPYTNDDPVLSLKLEDVGCAAVMPLAAPIGTGLGIRNPHALQMIKARAKVPVIVDAGLGTASDVTQVFELGLDGALMNTAVARAQDPVAMAQAMNYGCRAGRLAYLAGRMPAKPMAESASPLTQRPWRN